jgi:galactonate dehydratase
LLPISNHALEIHMKVSKARIYVVKGGPITPVILELETDEGLTGAGEAGVAYGLGATAAAAMLKEMVERDVLGKDPFRIEEIWNVLYDQSFWTKGGGAISFAAVSAIEQALWDIKGKAVGLPVYDFLGGKVNEEVDVYANGWNYHCYSALDWARAAERPLKDGYRSLKCYPLATQLPGGTLHHVTRRRLDKDFTRLAFDRVKELRNAVGDDVEILLDLSGGLTTDETIRLARRLEQFDIGWLEEPVDAFHTKALKKVSDAVSMPIACGERIYTAKGFFDIVADQAVDILQPDIGNTGGILETKKIAALAEAANMRVAPHNCASSLSTAATLQLSGCLSNLLNVEIYPYFSDHPGYVQVLENPPEARIKDGKLAVGSEHGLGATLAIDRLRPHLVTECTVA